MWRQQVQQHLDAEEEEMEVFLGSRDALEQETTGGSQILDAAFSRNDQLHIIMVPADVQKSVLIKEEAPEEQWPDVDQQDANCVHIKEEEEEPWTILGGEQLSMKEETDVTSFSLTAVPFKSEDEDEKPLFSQLHQHQVEIGDLPTSSSGDHIESSTGDGEKDTKKPDLNAYRDDSDSSETEVSEDDEDDNDVNNPESQLKLFSDFGLKTEDTDEDWESSPSRVSESSVNSVHNKNGLKPFCCDLCEKRFSVKGNLTRHMMIHTGQKLLCDLCEKRFIDKASLKKHMKIHTGQKPFYCDLCGRQFKRRGCLNRHMIIHTGQKPFCCDQCSKKFTQNDNLKKHMMIHTGQKPFSCDQCSQKFTQNYNLKQHMIIHTGQKPFSCDLCEKRFTQNSHLKKHMEIHTGQKAFCCDFCDQTFTEKASLKKHMIIHTGQKPFSCDQCERRFIQKGHLNRHMRYHRGEKPFSCDLCEKRFTEKTSLKKHMKIHTCEKK